MNAQPQDDELIDKYVAYRDHLDAEQKAFDLRLKPYNDAMQFIAGEMQRRLQERGDESVKTEAGTAYKSTTTSFKVADRDKFFDFIRESDEFSLLTSAVAKDAVKTYAEEHQGMLPPGLEASQFTKVNFRRG